MKLKRLTVIWCICLWLYHGTAGQKEGSKFDVLKFYDQPFPAAWAYPAATYPGNSGNGEEIAEYTYCYRFYLDSYNNGRFMPLVVERSEGNWWVIQSMYDLGSENGKYQLTVPQYQRNVPEGGLGGKFMPSGHRAIYPEDIQISKWYHTCTAYSSISHRMHMYHNGQKIFSFTYEDEVELPLPEDTFNLMQFGWNMRGRMTDLQIFNEFLDHNESIAWTTSCTQKEGQVFNWDKKKIHLLEVSHAKFEYPVSYTVGCFRKVITTERVVMEMQHSSPQIRPRFVQILTTEELLGRSFCYQRLLKREKGSKLEIL